MKYTQKQEHIQVPISKRMKEFIKIRLQKYGYDLSSAFRDLYEYDGLLSPEDVQKVDELQRIANIVIGKYAGLMQHAKYLEVEGRLFGFNPALEERLTNTNLHLDEASSLVDYIRDIQDYILKGQRPKHVLDVFDVFPSTEHFEYFVEEYPMAALRLAETGSTRSIMEAIEANNMKYDTMSKKLYHEKKARWRAPRDARFTIPVTARFRNKVGIGPKESFSGFWSVPSSDVTIPEELSTCADDYLRKRMEIKMVEKDDSKKKTRPSQMERAVRSAQEGRSGYLW